MAKINVRLSFDKIGRGVYISHLDLMRVFQRAFYRAELPLRYSEGFNPHAYLSVALPLQVGVESVCERMDFGVTDVGIDMKALPEQLNAFLPEGIVVTGAEIAERQFAEIGYVEIEFKADTQCEAERLDDIFAAPLILDKKTKKGVAKTDITSMIREIAFKRKDGFVYGSAVLCAQNPTLSPEYIEKAVREYADPEAEFEFRRTALLDFDSKPFDSMPHL